MPELPEVQTVVTQLTTQGILGATCIGGEVYWTRSVGGDADGFLRNLRGRSITKISRRGKVIVIHLDGPWVFLVHLRMSGMIAVVPPGHGPGTYDRVMVRMRDNRELRFRDPRKFGRFMLTADPDRYLSKLGVEPLSNQFTPRHLHAALSRRRRRLKPLLLDQTFIAGLGNIYADEALWEARLHPLRISNSLDREDVRRLHRAIRAVLRQAVTNRGTRLGNSESNFYPGVNRQAPQTQPQFEPRLQQQFQPVNQDFLKVFQRTGLPCFRCGTAVVRQRVGQRSTHFCPVCQREQV